MIPTNTINTMNYNFNYPIRKDELKAILITAFNREFSGKPDTDSIIPIAESYLKSRVRDLYRIGAIEREFDIEIYPVDGYGLDIKLI